MQKIRKKISNGLGCRTGTDARTDAQTDARTHKSEFIGSFQSLKTSGEPKILNGQAVGPECMYGRMHGRTDESEFIESMIFFI